MVDVVNVKEWIKENEKDFTPPVCNKCMYSDQLKMFFVGGPNQRKDYHLEEGEEVFYQLKGDMCLKVVENGQRRDLWIKEGEIFVLPSRVEHSPQRYENTIGAVVERTRADDEFDCVRYFIGESTDRQYERWLNLTDVVADLPPIIKGFHSSKAFLTGAVTDESFIQTPPYEPRPIDLRPPMNLKNLIEAHEEDLTREPVVIFGSPEYTSTTAIYGRGHHTIDSGKEEEVIVWSVEDGLAALTVDGIDYMVGNGDMARMQPVKKCKLDVREGTLLVIRMPGKAKKVEESDE